MKNLAVPPQSALRGTAPPPLILKLIEIKDGWGVGSNIMCLTVWPLTTLKYISLYIRLDTFLILISSNLHTI